MDKQSHKLACEFFRNKIKTLAKRIKHNKNALRHNQRIRSKGIDEPTMQYDASGVKYTYYGPEYLIQQDKDLITGYHIVYGEIRGKTHMEKTDNYINLINFIKKELDEYLSKELSKELSLEGA